jgi:ABC-type spermidine/putrescine transport system permease subunit II
MSLFLANSKLTSLPIDLFAYLKHSFDPTEAAVSAAIGVALVLVLDIHAVRGAQEVLMRSVR